MDGDHLVMTCDDPMAIENHPFSSSFKSVNRIKCDDISRSFVYGPYSIAMLKYWSVYNIV